ncbi:MAG: hypothetical protein DRK00_10550 [Thermoprotei archaeon]|nr:MAG: hypothetical protein DRK00_10550 [Thermoprotei archaeon]
MRRVTSVRIEDELWRKVKALAALEGTTVSSILEEALTALVRGAEKAASFEQPGDHVVEELKAIRARGGDPLIIAYPEKTAVELVEEGRGD